MPDKPIDKQKYFQQEKTAALRQTLSEADAEAFDALVADYKNASFRIMGKFLHNPKVLAELAKAGWRKK